MATVPSRNPTGGHREDSEISTTNFLQGAPILEFVNFEMEIVSESDIRGWFIVSEKSALVCVCVCMCVPPKALSVELGNFFLLSLALSLSLSLSLSSTALEPPHLSRLRLLCRVSASKLKNFDSSFAGIWSSTWRHYCIYCREYGKHGCCSCLRVAESGRHRNECCALERSAPRKQGYGKGSAAENWEENSGMGKRRHHHHHHPLFCCLLHEDLHFT